MGWFDSQKERNFSVKIVEYVVRIYATLIDKPSDGLIVVFEICK